MPSLLQATPPSAVTAVAAEHSALNLAKQSAALGGRAILLCDPGHAFTSARHHDGYRRSFGTDAAPCRSPGQVPLERNYGVYAVATPTQGAATRPFRVSINRRWPAQKLGLPPSEKRWARYNASFREEEHTPASLLAQVAQGYAFTAVLGGCQGLCCGTWCITSEHKVVGGHCGRPQGYRANRHFQCAQFVALDFDTGDERSTFGYLLSQPLVAQHSAFLYTTLSHITEHPKARAVFITNAPFTDPSHYRRAKLALMEQLPWGDASVHDPSRLFYGTHPREGESHYQGRILPMAVVDELIEQYGVQLEGEQDNRELPRIPASRVMGSTPAERYVSAAVQAQAAWVASRVEGTGDRHKGLLVSAMKLGSLRLAEWLPMEVRATITPCAVLLPAARENGYTEKYGEATAIRIIQDGIAYATPRAQPESWNTARPRIWRIRGGHLQVEVSL